MGVDKEKITQTEDNWKRMAKQQGLRCYLCSSIIEYTDKEVFFGSKLCGSCDNTTKKDD